MFTLLTTHSPLLEDVLPRDLFDRVYMAANDPHFSQNPPDPGFLPTWNGATGEHIKDVPLLRMVRCSRRKLRALCAENIEVMVFSFRSRSKSHTNVLSMAKNFRVSLTTMKIIQSPLSSTMVRLRLGMSSSELTEHTPLFARPFLGRKMQSRPLYPTQLSICMSDMATQRRPCSCDRSIP